MFSFAGLDPGSYCFLGSNRSDLLGAGDLNGTDWDLSRITKDPKDRTPTQNQGSDKPGFGESTIRCKIRAVSSVGYVCQ